MNATLSKANEVFEDFKTDPKFYQLFRDRIFKLKTNISHTEICRLSEELENCNQELFDKIYILNADEYTELQNLVQSHSL